MPRLGRSVAVTVRAHAVRVVLFLGAAVIAYLLLSTQDHRAHADPGLPNPPVLSPVTPATTAGLDIPSPDIPSPVTPAPATAAPATAAPVAPVLPKLPDVPAPVAAPTQAVPVVPAIVSTASGLTNLAGSVDSAATGVVSQADRTTSAVLDLVTAPRTVLGIATTDPVNLVSADSLGDRQVVAGQAPATPQTADCRSRAPSWRGGTMFPRTGATGERPSSTTAPEPVPPGAPPPAPNPTTPETARSCARGSAGGQSPVAGTLASTRLPDLSRRMGGAVAHASARSRSVLPGHLPG